LNNQETNRNTVNSQIPDARALFEVYYPAFQAASNAGCASAMCSYNLVNGTHSCSSEQLLLKDLKTSMNFTGFVMSDCKDLKAEFIYSNDFFVLVSLFQFFQLSP